MNSALEAALRSWSFASLPILALALTALVYARGWRQLHRQIPHRFPRWRLVSFLGGIATLFLALLSPLDAFAGLLLQVHMIQHLLLMMIAPPLLLLGTPYLPLLCGLPRKFVREALGPFLVWPALRNFGRKLTHPMAGGIAYIAASTLWHVPALYELALRSKSWHEFEHACFVGTALLFWWPVVQPWPGRAHWPRWAMIPYLLVADLQNTALAAFLSFYDRALYPTYEVAPRLWNFSVLNDQAAAGAIMWVPGSLAFLIPVGLITVQILSGRRGVRPKEFFAQRDTRPKALRSRRREEADSADAHVTPPPHVGGYGARQHSAAFDLLRAPGIGAILRWPHFRRVAQIVMFLIALLIVADGLLGPQLSPMNLAGVLPWTHWRGLAVIALLAAGNLFCMTCPFMLVRDAGRRWLSARWPWPRALRSKWLAVALLAVYLWAYEAFSLWDRSWWTAWIVVGYFAAALVIDGLFKGASFCKYVCPIGQFQFVQSLSSPLEVKVREPEICQTCATHDCIRGNATQRGCELHLFQPRKSGNMDCTFCLDCIKACPHDNVGILAVAPAFDLSRDTARSSVGRFAQRPDLAALVLLLVFGAFVNAAGMIAPVVQWEDRLAARFGFHSTPPIVTTLLVVALLIVPPLLALVCGWCSHVFGRANADPKSTLLSLTCDFTMALAPLGLAMWGAHFLFHLITGAHTALLVLQRATTDIGLTWLGAPDWTTGSLAFARSWSPALQVLLLDGGLLLTLYVAWRIAHRRPSQFRSAARAFAPWAALATVLFGIGVWIFLQPMQMRGMTGVMM